MQIIKDERLVIKNLKNIRIAYIIQTLGIITILAYDLITKGFDEMTSNPLWFVFIVTIVVSGYLSMSVSVEHESQKKSPKKGLTISLIVLTIIGIILGSLTALTEGYSISDGILIGGIIFLCGLAPILYIYYLRKKRSEE